jgi:hypothetical protein
MRPKKPETTRSGDLFRARLDQIINLKHELAQLAGQIDWDFIGGEIAPPYSDKGRPGLPTRFAIGCCCSSTFIGYLIFKLLADRQYRMFSGCCEDRAVRAMNWSSH